MASAALAWPCHTVAGPVPCAVAQTATILSGTQYLISTRLPITARHVLLEQSPKALDIVHHAYMALLQEALLAPLQLWLPHNPHTHPPRVSDRAYVVSHTRWQDLLHVVEQI
jgi:hypothetical protein